MIDEFLKVDTPENVVFGYEVVGIGSRFIAALIDSLIILVLQGVAALGFGFILLTAFEVESLEAWITAVYLLLAFALLWGYYIFFELLWNGQSPGKRWNGLRVIRQDGTPITLTESIIRNLIRIVDFLPGFYGLGLVVMFADQRARRLGDLAAGTLVVREQEQVTLESLKAAPPVNLPLIHDLPDGNVPPVEEWPTQLLTEADVQLIESFLSRQNNLHNRNALGRFILKQMLTRLGLSDQPVSPADTAYVLSRLVASRRTGEIQSNL